MLKNSRSYIAFCFFLIGQVALYGQVCPQTDYFFRDQSSIDSFAANNMGCSIITGNVRIEEKEAGGIQHLGGLESLQVIRGHLDIYDNVQLNSLDGLQQLDSVGHLRISENPVLNDITGLQGLFSVQSLILSYNVMLVSLEGLEQIKEVSTLEIRDTGIRNLEGLSSLIRIDSHLILAQNDSLLTTTGITLPASVGGRIDILQNKSLEDLSIMQGIITVQGDVLIRSNVSLPDIDELGSLESIGSTCVISGNSMLTHLGGLGRLEMVNGNMTISNANLERCQGLEQLRKIGGDLRITSGGKLTDLSAFVMLDSILGHLQVVGTGVEVWGGWPQLQFVGGTLELRQNAELLTITGMGALESVGGMWIDENRRLEYMDGLASLRSVRGNLRINYNSRLKQLPNWQELRLIDGDLILERSPDVSNLAGLDSLVSIGGQLLLYALGVDSLTGLEQLESCDGGLTLRNLDVQDLDPLLNLRSIQGPLIIQENGDLLNLEGIRQLETDGIEDLAGGPDIIIIDNPFLVQCAIEPLCNLFEGSGRTFDIQNNGAGCNSPFDIQTKCQYPYACLPDGITLSRQTQIDSFKLLYPGCLFLQGNIVITETEPGNITGLDSLDGIGLIGGELRISNNDVLEDLDGFTALTRIGGGIRITNNDALVDLTGLDQVDPFTLTETRPTSYDLWLTGNKLLTACNSTLICTLFTDPEALYVIQGNTPECSHPDSVLQHCVFPSQCMLDTITRQSVIDEFPVRHPGCTELMGDLILMPTDESLVYVNNLDGLEQLTSIRGSIEIYNADALLNLNGLQQVTQIDGRIHVFGNNKLETLDGLRHIDPATVSPVQGHALIISHNPLISDCSLENICQVLVQQITSSIIGNNAPGCDDEGEVLDACIVSVPGVDVVELLKIYPNPTSGWIELSLPDEHRSWTGPVYVYDAAGALVGAFDGDSPFFLDGVGPGLYTLVLRTSDQRYYLGRITMLP